MSGENALTPARELGEDASPRTVRRRTIFFSVAGTLVIALVATALVYAAIRPIDTDGDRIPDHVERAGWATSAGATFVTDPYRADTDGDGLSDGVEAGTELTANGITKYSGSSDPTRSDSDGDGLNDPVETLGWLMNGVVFVTDPMHSDSDRDGLSDAEEAGLRLARRGPRAAFNGVSNPLVPDSDGDGLSDKTEVQGWITAAGMEHRTNPMLQDTDGDHLSDADEASTRERRDDGTDVYMAISNPLLADTDGDGLPDLDEADLGTDAFAADTDGDGLGDLAEAVTIGSSALSVDTDGDGQDDAYEVSRADSEGLDPLVADELLGADRWADDFVAGAFAGELDPRPSTAWLAGNLTAGATSAIPVVGPLVGTVVDVRDAIGSAMHGDWVGTALSTIGVVPVAGDAVSIPAKVGKFVGRHPELAAGAAALVASLKFIPEAVQLRAIKAAWGASWDQLAERGYSTRTLLKLQRDGRNDLHALAAAVTRPTHVRGNPAPFFRNGPLPGRAGEAHLAQELRDAGAEVAVQKVVSTKGCIAVCRASVRRFDVFDLTTGIAHESKVGFKVWDREIEKQIRSDAYVMHATNYPEVKGAHWHFYASVDTQQIGADPRVLNLLDEVGIPYTIHTPR